MFNTKEKQYIARELEKILLELNHSEMPKEKVNFKLHVDGAEDWSWADIIPNHTHDAISENQENYSQQPLKTNTNVGSKSYRVEKNELGSVETGVLTSSGVEDHLPKSDFSPADTNSESNEVEE